MGRNGNRSLLGSIGEPAPFLAHLPRCPYGIGLRLCKLEVQVSEDRIESPPRKLSRARKSTPFLKTSSTKKERRIIVAGDSLLRGTEGFMSARP